MNRSRSASPISEAFALFEGGTPLRKEIEQTCSAPSKAVQELLATAAYISHRAFRELHARGGEAMQLQRIRRDNSSIEGGRPRPAVAGATLEFGRFRVQPRARQLLADGVAIELGARAFDLLLALLEADGSLVTKDELLRRVWPGIFVAEENLKVQISALRKALGEDRDFIRTEFGRGYRFTAEVRSTAAWNACPRSTRQKHPSGATPFRQWSCRRSLQGWPASGVAADTRTGSERRHG